MLALLMVFNGCRKEEPVNFEEPGLKSSDMPMFEGIKDIGFSVEDNRLVFDSEDDFQKGIDFLAKLGDENFPAFEEAIGFESYRRTFIGTKNWAEQIEDKLFATLINPEGIIQIENFLFQVDFTKNTTFVFILNELENELKSSYITSKINAIELDWKDDGFAILKDKLQSNEIMADYCTVNREKKKEWNFNSGVEDGISPFLNIDIKAKLVYQHFTFYHSLITKIKSDKFRTSMGTRFVIKMKSIGDIKWNLKGEEPQSKPIDLTTEIGSAGPGLDFRPFASRHRVQSYYAYVRYEWELVYGALPPYNIGDIGYIYHFLECPY